MREAVSEDVYSYKMPRMDEFEGTGKGREGLTMDMSFLFCKNENVLNLMAAQLEKYVFEIESFTL